MTLPVPDACIYAVVFASGVVKVGKSQSQSHLIWRLRAHKAMGKVFGDTLLLEKVIDVAPNEVLRRERIFMAMCDGAAERNSESTSCEWFRFSSGEVAANFIETAMLQVAAAQLPIARHLVEVVREKKQLKAAANQRKRA